MKIEQDDVYIYGGEQLFKCEMFSLFNVLLLLNVLANIHER